MGRAELDYALYNLAAAHDSAAGPVLSAFVDQPDPAVRRYAAEVLQELPGRQPGRPLSVEKAIGFC